MCLPFYFKEKYYFVIGGTKIENNQTLFIYNFLMKGNLKMKDRYLTVTEVAEMLKVSYDTALHFIKYNVEHINIGRQYRVLESKLNAALYPPKIKRQIFSNRPIYQIVERK